MKIAVLGANGMLGTDLTAACADAGIEVLGYDLPELDITAETCPLDSLADCERVVNCAAYTHVDGAETERDSAFAVNRDGAGRVAEWCARQNIPLLHISTDYVFDGIGKVPYKEDNPVKPLNAYGESKLAGEQAVLNASGRHLVVRTQSLFGRNGHNFVQAIMSRIEKGDTTLDVVNDQTSCPTYTVHLARAIVRLLDINKEGIVHVSASGECTWYEFAVEIIRKTGASVEVMPVSSDNYVKAARRPAYSVLDKSLYSSWTGTQMPSWQQGLDEYLGGMGRK